MFYKDLQMYFFCFIAYDWLCYISFWSRFSAGFKRLFFPLIGSYWAGEHMSSLTGCWEIVINHSLWYRTDVSKTHGILESTLKNVEKVN